jgi:hypothetical protein
MVTAKKQLQTGGAGSAAGGAGGMATNPGGAALGAAGGSGVVIISYSGSVQLMAGGTVTVSGGNVIHTFTSSGFLTPIVLTTNSLRFRSSASASLSRTPTSATNRTTWTWSGWVKRAEITTTERTFFGAGTDGNNFTALAWINDGLYFQNYTSGTQTITNTTAVFRDPSAWYHIVLAIDTTQATAANRAKIYVNGVQQAGFSGTPFSSSQQFWINFTYTHRIGSRQLSSADSFSEQYMADINFVDGQALTPNSFGTSNGLGVWQPIRYGGSYGTNGFYLPFTNTTSTTTLGYDFSPQGNNWTTNNISLTAGTTYDSMTDVPTLTSATTANYCVLSPIDTYDNPPTEGNLRRTGVGHTGSPWSTCRATLGVSSGKWYFEGTFTGSTGSVGNNMIGVMTTTTSTLSDAYGGSTTRSYQANGGLQGDNSTGTVSSATSGDVIMIAFDVDAGKLWVGKNGTWMNSGVPASGTGNVFTTLPTSPIVPQVSMYGNTGDNYGWFTNFGQRPFSYTPPTGFVRLNTFNLPTPTIGATASTTANKYMDVLTWTGNGASSRAITGLNFQPDWVWDKMRSDAYQHAIVDSVRGGNQVLHSNSTSAEDTNWQYGYVSSFDSNGFTIQAGSTSSENWNLNAATFVAWNWNAGGTTVTNTAGSVSSQVRANPTAGFSVVTFTSPSGTGNFSAGHGLGVTPSMVIVKSRDSSGVWYVYHTSLATDYYLRLNGTNAAGTDGVKWGDGMTSSVIGLRASYSTVSGATTVAYCFAAVPGYSAFGSYTGNSSTNGTFIYLGFRPRFIMIKRATSADPWIIHDTARDIYNGYSVQLYPNDASAEGGSYSPPILDEVSNGFKLRSSASGTNDSASTYIYMAFAENPFKYANAR